MRNVILMTIAVGFVGCINATAEDNLTIQTDLNLPALTPAEVQLIQQEVQANPNSVPVSLSQSTSIDIHDQLQKLDDNSNGLSYELFLTSDQFSCDEGLEAIDSLSLMFENSTQSQYLVPTTVLSDAQKNSESINFVVNTNQQAIIDMLRAGEVKLTVSVEPNLNALFTGRIPQHIHNITGLDVKINVDKSL